MRWRRREGHQGADEKKAAQAKAWGLWLDCLEQKNIAAEIGVSEGTISEWFSSRKSAEIEPPESRQHFDVWSFTTAAKAWGLWLDCLPQTEIAEQHPDPAAGPPE